MKNDNIYKIMSDGSIVAISANDKDNQAFSNADELISSFDVKLKKDSLFKITIRKKGE